MSNLLHNKDLGQHLDAEQNDIINSESDSVIGEIIPHQFSTATSPDVCDYLRRELLPEILAETVYHACLRNKVAVRCGQRSLTYGELYAEANQLARYLRSLGVDRGDRVILLMPRGLEAIVGFLGIMQAGAAYVPLDPDCPADRAAYVCTDSGARYVLTSKAIPAGVHLPCHPIIFEDSAAAIAGQSSAPLSRAETGLQPDDCAYIIYTSGSTGKPKGVMIAHQSISHLVRAEGSVLQLQEADLVFQGFSLSFDMSLEEIWLTFAAGATLLVGTTEMIQAGCDLSKILAKEGITVWQCVPTLLAMQETDIPTLRLINLGGEACPPDLVRRWYRPGRRIFNTYGPTETSITATVAECLPGAPVTIGRPLPNYTVYLLDDDWRLVRPGESGELCIGGPGLAIGYVGRPDLTREKFIANPFYKKGAIDPLLYRSGDLARYTENGEIEFLGRIDAQVKIRGYRVELSEIEAVLVETPALRQAAVLLHRDELGVDQLVAYIVLRPGTQVDEAALIARLRTKLPSYMVPTVLEQLPELPTLASGKIDRKRLPAPTKKSMGSAPAAQAPVELPTTPAEKLVHKVWSEIFSPAQVSIDHDFFRDLGGHSLRAAMMISRLRKEPGYQHASMLDVYRNPVLSDLAAHLGGAATATAASAPPKAVTQKVPRLRHFLCGSAQAVSVVFLYLFGALEFVVPFLSYAWLTSNDYTKVQSAAIALSLFVVLIPAMLVVTVATKWLLLGRIRPGTYPLWGVYYFRWWFVNNMLDHVQAHYFSGTPLMAWYFRLLGAKIGKNVHLRTDSLDAPDLISIGDDTSVGEGTQFNNVQVEDGNIIFGQITIGSDCYIGSGSVLKQGVAMGNGAHLGELSLLAQGQVIPAGELWGGSPSDYVGQAPVNRNPRPSLAKRMAYGFLFAFFVLTFPVWAVAPIFPGMMFMSALDQATDGYHFLLFSPVLAVIFIIGMCLEIVAFKWLLLGRVTPGRWPVYSEFYVRRWFVDKLMDLSLDIVKPLYATLYFAPWYRALGVKLGKNAEVSTASGICHDLLTIDDESFVADAVMLGVPRVKDGEIHLERTTVGKRAFLGNSALLPAGTTVGDDVLIGCLSVPPVRESDAQEKNSSWFGTPAVFLPQRQIAQADESQTFKPSRSLYLQRLFWEFFRVTLPLTCIIAMNSLLMSYIADMDDGVSWAGIIWRVATLDLVLGLGAGVFVVVLKWVLIGKYRPVEKPLWNNYVWRSELVTSTYEELGVTIFMENLVGTPFASWYLRLMGCKVGKRVFIDTTDITEHDVVTIGDEAVLNADCGLQTHLFEDRVMKIGNIEVGAGCTVGAQAIVLYDTRMEDGSSLDSLSMLMKGETLPAGTAWRGSPARSVA